MSLRSCLPTAALVVFLLALVPLSPADDQPSADRLATDVVAEPSLATRSSTRMEGPALSFVGTVVAPRQTLLASEVAGIVDQVHVRIGSRVDRDAALLALRSRPLELELTAARAELAEALAEQRSTELRLERLTELESSQVVSRQNVDDARFEAQAAEGRVARLGAEVARLDYQLDHSVVRSPMAGIVVSEPAQVGQWLAIGDPVLELLADGDLEVRIDVGQEHFATLRVGALATVRSSGHLGRAIAARVRAVVPRAGEGSRTFPVYLSLDTTSGLGAGMSVDVQLSVGTGVGDV